MSKDIKTKSLVLRRTNYGEADRILNLITPDGKFSVIAKSARQPRSRLAGGIELFTLSDIIIHQGRGELGILTSAKMHTFYQHILSDLNRLELATSLLRKVDRLTNHYFSPDHFHLTAQILSGLNQGFSPQLVQTWALLQLSCLSGEELNLLVDQTSTPLNPKLCYFWDQSQLALSPHCNGNLTASHIKFLRFLLVNPLALCAKIKDYDTYLPAIQPVISSLNI